jgi:hypothetical protein
VRAGFRLDSNRETVKLRPPAQIQSSEIVGMCFGRAFGGGGAGAFGKAFGGGGGRGGGGGGGDRRQGPTRGMHTGFCWNGVTTKTHGGELLGGPCLKGYSDGRRQRV